MGKVRIAVCDDERKAVSIISGAAEAVFAAKKIDVAIDEYLSPAKLLECIERRAYDLIFLDICMPELDGIKLGKKIAGLGRSHTIIFISSRMDRMFDTFAVQPFGFVRKTHFMDDISEVIDRYIEQRSSAKEDDEIHFKNQSGDLVSVRINQLKYIECYKNVQRFVLDGEDDKKLYSRMNILEEQLKDYGFIRTHKGYLVNCKYIQRLDRKTLMLSTGEVLPVGRSRYHQAMDEYMSYVSTYGIILGE